AGYLPDALFTMGRAAGRGSVLVVVAALVLSLFLLRRESAVRVGVAVFFAVIALGATLGIALYAAVLRPLFALVLAWSLLAFVGLRVMAPRARVPVGLWPCAAALRRDGALLVATANVAVIAFGVAAHLREGRARTRSAFRFSPE